MALCHEKSQIFIITNQDFFFVRLVAHKLDLIVPRWWTGLWHYGTQIWSHSAKVISRLMALCHKKSQILIITNQDFLYPSMTLKSDLVSAKVVAGWWHCGTEPAWHYGTMALWHWTCLALWHYGTMALNLRLDSAKVISRSMALWHWTCLALWHWTSD